MDTLVVEIADSSNEQTQSISQVNIAITQMDTITQSNAGSSEETAAASKELSYQASAMLNATAELRQLVGYESKQFANESANQEPNSSSDAPDDAFVDWGETSNFENDYGNRIGDTKHQTQLN